MTEALAEAHIDTLSLSLSRHIPAPVEAVFNAWTRVETVQKWLAPGDMIVAEAQIDLRPGGHYRVVMQNPDGSQCTPYGEYTLIKPHSELRFTWAWENSDDPVTELQLRFTEVEGGTLLELFHHRFDSVTVRDEHNKGWLACLDQLEILFTA